MIVNKADERTMPVLYASESECCGCGACISICPKDAIIMHSDSFGFKYPHIDEKICIVCNMCIKVCAFKRDLLTASGGC